MATELNMGMKCIKYMLLTVNLMFVFTAALIISIGTAIYAIYSDYDHFIHDAYYSPASLLVAIGIIMLFVSVFGCCGAAKESTLMINIFALLLTLVFILEIAAAIAAYSLQAGLYDLIADKLKMSQNDYMDGGESRAAFDMIQSRLECCGIDRPSDWYGKYTNGSIDFQTDKIVAVPESCCSPAAQNMEEIPNTCNSLISYNTGCMTGLLYVIGQSAVLLGTGAMTIAFIQFIGIIFSVMLGREIRLAKTERERRRQEIRQQIVNNYTSMEPHQVKSVADPMPVIYVPAIGQTKI